MGTVAAANEPVQRLAADFADNIPAPHLEEIAKHPYNVGNWLHCSGRLGKETVESLAGG